MKDPVVGVSKNALVDGYQVLLSSELNYEAAAKASAAGEKAFVRATKHVVKNMTDSHRKMLEVQAIHGRNDLGVIDTVSTTTVTITAATWAPGIWAGAEGTRIDINNTGLTANNVDSAVVSSVDFTNRQVVFTTDVAAAGAVATDRLFYEDAVTSFGPAVFAENEGIHFALNQSGTIWGIDSSAFNLWQASSVTAGSGPLLFDHVQEASARVAEKGGIDGLNRLYISNLTWIDLLGDQAALRRYDEEGSTSRYATGAQAITFHTATGPVDIVPSIYMKRGFAYLLNLNSWYRTGAQDFAFGDPIDKNVFHRLESRAGADMRSYSNVSVFSESLGRNCLINNIVNNAS